MTQRLLLTACLLSMAAFTQAQKVNRAGGDPKLSEYWEPEVKVVAPGKTAADAPADAIVLFDGSNTSAWEAKNGGPIKWKVENGAMTVTGGAGEIHTTQGFGDCQLHIEWRTPEVVKGEGQGRGNSGIFLMGKYELQVLDSYNNKLIPTDRQAASTNNCLPWQMPAAVPVNGRPMM